MAAKDWISVLGVLAWPIVAVLALIYIWRSDAIAKLIQIAGAVKDLEARLAELVETEKRLSDRSVSISETVAVLKQASENFAEIKAGVEIIVDRGGEEGENTVVAAVASATAGSVATAVGTADSAEERFGRIEAVWGDLMLLLGRAFGGFDKRSVAGEVYRYAHGNRKGVRLTYETAEEIARLHTSIKSFRRRKSTIDNWLDQEISLKFIDACVDAIGAVSKETAA